MKLTIELGERQNITVLVIKKDLNKTVGPKVVGEVEISHPSYVEHFVLIDNGANTEHTHEWQREDTRKPATITETLLLWHIFNHDSDEGKVFKP